ncbi:MAG: hypothetical protein ACK40G_00155 [Cytophagaceae bacterium]
MKIFIKIILQVGCLFWYLSAHSQDTSFDVTNADTSFKKKELFPSFSFSSVNDLKNSLFPSEALSTIRVSGIVQFMAFYRQMDYAYADLATPLRNLATLAYPAATPTGNSTGPPLMELEIEGRPIHGSVFRVGYSNRHLFTGQLGDTARGAFIRELLRFEGIKYTDFGTFRLVAGGGANWLSVSPMTLSNKNFRVDPFEKLPWDWHNSSVKKYLNYHKNPGIRTDERFVGAPVQGFTFDASGLPGGFGALVFYGRSNRTVVGNDINNNPAYFLFVSRIDKGFRQHKVGINYYGSMGDADAVRHVKDNREIITSDFRLRFARFRIITELGAGRVTNPIHNSEWDRAVDFRIEIDKSVTKVPVYLQFYSIGRNVVSQEAAFMQSNMETPSGGYHRNPATDNNLDLNVLQEIGMTSNNRQGGALRLEEKFGRIKLEFGSAMNQELENTSNVISVQYRSYAFTRSRFRPFTNNTGPYQNISNRNRRSYLRITVQDSISNYRKSYNNLEFTAKYMIKVLNRDLILANYNHYGSVGEKFSPLPGFNESMFVRTFYEEFSAFYLITRKLVILGSFSLETITANNRTMLSPETGNPIDQQSIGYGLGLDYDFADRAGIYIRHRWIRHEDKNFLSDRFKGQETHIELKVFF